MEDLAGRVALVTGAAGNLGSATARAFEAAGAHLVLVGHSVEGLRRAFEDLSDSAVHLLAGGVDLTDEAAVERVVQESIGRFGRIDVLVNTVGTFRGGRPVHEEPWETWEKLFAVNVKTAVLCCGAVAPHMLEAGTGSIVNVASRNASRGDAGVAAYSAAKAGVLRLTESLAAELGDRGIRANAVLPGTLDTPENREADPGADTSGWIAPEAVAEVILFLASEAARGIQGAAIPVFGPRG